MSTASSSQPIRVLYVEDNELVREITCELLAQEGREITACGTAEEALREFNRQPFDVVITDVSLPVMTGLDLAKSILNIRPSAPVIIASGYAISLGLEQWGSNLRAITKPFDAEQIDALIEDLLPPPAGDLKRFVG